MKKAKKIIEREMKKDKVFLKILLRVTPIATVSLSLLKKEESELFQKMEKSEIIEIVKSAAKKVLHANIEVVDAWIGYEGNRVFLTIFESGA